MIDVLKAFYTIHYNFAAVSILLLLLLILLLSKKNVKFGIVVLAILVVFNVALFKRTDGKSWTLTQEETKDEYGIIHTPESMTFSADTNWVNDKGIIMGADTIHHWCWMDQKWAEFASMDLVAKIWGENSSKKMIKASEAHGSF